MTDEFVPPYLKYLSPEQKEQLRKTMEMVQTAAAHHGIAAGSNKSDWGVYWAQKFIDSLK